MEFPYYPTVKIVTKEGHTETFIDGFKVKGITNSIAELDSSGNLAKVTLSLLANVEIDADSNVFVIIDGEKYNLQRITE